MKQMNNILKKQTKIRQERKSSEAKDQRFSNLIFWFLQQESQTDIMNRHEF